MAVIIGLNALDARLRAIASPEMRRGFMGRLTLRTEAAMKRRIPRKTSTTSRSIHHGQITETKAEIIGNRNVIWLDTGTRPHIIRPVRRKALRWAAQPQGRRLSGAPRKAAQRGEFGGVRFATVVHHPGTRAQPYIDASVREALTKSDLADIIIERWNGAA